MGIHLVFAGNVAAHLVALMSGITSFIFATISAVKKKPLLEKWFWIAGAICLIAAFDGAWQDEHRNTQAVIAEKAAAVSLGNSCTQDRRIESAYAMGLEGTGRNQQQTINAQQQTINSQQKDVSSCVVSLGKMNPRVREEIVVVSIPLYTYDPNTQKLASSFAVHKRYVSELIITTNEREPRFHGFLRCENDFVPLNTPQLPSSSQTVMTTSVPPHRISEREYEISTSATGTDWSPANPAYMGVSTSGENPGKCTFTPQ